MSLRKSTYDQQFLPPVITPKTPVKLLVEIKWAFETGFILISINLPALSEVLLSVTLKKWHSE